MSADARERRRLALIALIDHPATPAGERRAASEKLASMGPAAPVPPPTYPTYPPVCRWVTDQRFPGEKRWAIIGAPGALFVGAGVIVRTRAGVDSLRQVTGLGPCTRYGQIAYVD